jgi:hypothetical protein
MSENSTKRTPGPWRIYKSDDGFDDCPDFIGFGVTSIHESMLDSDGDPTDICEMVNVGHLGVDVCEANAAFIVTACNAYDSLVSENARMQTALEILSHPENFKDTVGMAYFASIAHRASLAQQEGGA